MQPANPREGGIAGRQCLAPTLGKHSTPAPSLGFITSTINIRSRVPPIPLAAPARAGGGRQYAEQLEDEVVRLNDALARLAAVLEARPRPRGPLHASLAMSESPEASESLVRAG